MEFECILVKDDRDALSIYSDTAVKDKKRWMHLQFQSARTSSVIYFSKVEIFTEEIKKKYYYWIIVNKISRPLLKSLKKRSKLASRSIKACIYCS